MTDWWFVLWTLAVGFMVGLLVGYRQGVIAGFDKAEKMLGEITAQQYRRLRAQEKEGYDLGD